MPSPSTGSLELMRAYKTLLHLQTSSAFPLTFSSLCPSPFAACPQLCPSPSFVHHPRFKFSLPWHRKCYATDIQMMMPWIWCLNAIIPPPCSPPSPSSPRCSAAKGALCGKLEHTIVSAHISSFPVAQRTDARQCILIIRTFKFAFLLLFLHHQHQLALHLFLELSSPLMFPFSYIHLTRAPHCSDAGENQVEKGRGGLEIVQFTWP